MALKKSNFEVVDLINPKQAYNSIISLKRKTLETETKEAQHGKPRSTWSLGSLTLISEAAAGDEASFQMELKTGSKKIIKEGIFITDTKKVLDIETKLS